ncbi:FAD-binding protein [Candidatus Woesearchaeota archaeon]|nr:FAD-binding protein [Candidatus Woesearchaeota archaeon]
MISIKEHDAEVDNIVESMKLYSKSNSAEKLIFTHVGSHSTREKSRHTYNKIDISHLNNIILINKKKLIAEVEPSVTMKQLLDECLKFGLMPKVVMEFSDITVGGAIEGAALESSSFKFGQFNDSCTEYEVILPTGKKVIANKNSFKDLFYGKTGSYGSLGLLTKVKISLIKSKNYVDLTYNFFSSVEESIEYMESMMKRNVDFIDGIVFSSYKVVIISGKLSDSPNFEIRKFTRAFDPWFYKHVDSITKDFKVKTESVPLKDYYFRYDRAAYWMGQYFVNYVGGYNLITRTLFNQSLSTRRMYKALHLGNLSQMFFIQDFYTPLNKTADFIKYTKERVNVFPIWLCPVKPTKKLQKLSPHYSKAKFLINVGFYGRSKKFAENYLKSNRDIEKFANSINARKMLYAHAYYPKEEFWKLYDLRWYKKLRKKYGAEKCLLDVFERTHVKEKYKPTIILGAIKFYWQLLTQGKKF